MSEELKDRKTRAVTAVLSGIGATAGVGGLAYGANDMRRARRMGKKIPLRAKALVPLEVAGLSGELMATKILHGDAKRKPVAKGRTMDLITPTEVAKHLVTDAGNGHGTSLVSKADRAGRSRFAETMGGAAAMGGGGGWAATNAAYAASDSRKARRHTQSANLLSGMSRQADAAGNNALGSQTFDASMDHRFSAGRHKSNAKAFRRRAGKGALVGLAGTAVLAHGVKRTLDAEAKVGKARRFDPEADRQRRLGTYAGLAGGGAIVAGDRLAREIEVGPIAGKPKTKGIGIKRGKKGVALAGATAGLAALSAGSLRRGVSERNQSWT